MTTLAGTGQTNVLKSEEDLAHYFEAFAKPRQCLRVGLEAEFFGVTRNTGQALPYEGSRGIQEVLKRLAARFHYEPVLDEGNIIALKKGPMMIGLEPGGQVELSAPPVSNVFEIEEQVQSFMGELREISAEFRDIAWLAAGIHPVSRLEEISCVPKRRYAIMAEYFKTNGTQSHDMMKRTATNQLNVDYTSEENAMANLRTAFGITSIVTALFANSSFSEGRPSGFLTQRLDIWNHTAPERTGLLVEFLQPGRRFKDYLNYLLDMPLIFLVRRGKWIPAGQLTFRDFLKRGFQGEKATLGDFELHLSTAFPEVRLKQYLEIRGVDGQSPELIPAVAAFWKGILYDARASEEAWKLVSFATEEERMRLHQAVPREGLSAKLGRRSILPMARELVELSCQSLARQTSRKEGRDECIFLERIREKITRPGKSPAETILEKWEGEFAADPRRLIEYLRIA